MADAQAGRQSSQFPRTIGAIRARRSARGGFALLTVLFVLMALLVLCTPFMMTARNADQASAQIANRAQARLALDAAGRHARAKLSQSHPTLDASLYYDSRDELRVDNQFDQGFLNANDTHGVMWDTESADVAGP